MEVEVHTRLKFFAWLILLDRLTLETCFKGGIFMSSLTLCVLCNDQVLEDVNHLFFDCPFSTICWQKLGFSWDNSLDIHKRLEQCSIAMGLPYLIEIFIIAAWELWNLRNDKIFEGKVVNIQLWTVKFKAQVILQLHRVNEIYRSTVLDWLDTVL